MNWFLTLESGEQVEVFEDQDVSSLLGVEKWSPPIPVCMAGEVYNAGTHIGVNYDIENIKKFPDVLIPGEDIQVTEKIHGTFCQISVLPPTQDNFHEDHFFVTNNDTGHQAYIAISSKGLGGQGLFLKNNDRNQDNIYIRTARKYFASLTEYPVDVPFTVCGEVFGHNVQDLTYGYTLGQSDFRLFDVYIGRRGAGEWVDDESLDIFSEQYGIPRVPNLYRGPYARVLIDELTQHTKSVFDPKQIREGVVIKPLIERRDPVLGRVVLKSINEDYLTRKNATEYN